MATNVVSASRPVGQKLKAALCNVAKRRSVSGKSCHSTPLMSRRGSAQKTVLTSRVTVHFFITFYNTILKF